MTRVGVITQARMTSTRLPGKVLLRVGGRTILEHQVLRLQDAGLPVIVATSTNPSDEPLVDVCQDMGVPTFRGSEHDVLGRYAACVREYELTTVVRVTSDCPLIDGSLIARAIQDFEQAQDPWLYLSNTLVRTWPRGFDFEVFSGAALVEAAEFATERAEREHVTPYLYRNPDSRVRVRHVTRMATGAERYRVTLDTPQDLALITALIETHGAHRMSAEEIVAVLDGNPQIAALNSAIQQKPT